MARDRRTMLNRTLAATSLVATLLFSATNVQAITIENPSFELDGEYETPAIGNLPAAGAPTGWEFYRPASSDAGQYFGVNTVGTYYDQSAPDGSRVAYFDMGADGNCALHPCADGSYPLGLQQTLVAESLEKDSRYTLKVSIGNPKSGGNYNYEGFGGYRTELLAGTTVIGFDDDTNVPGEGEFVESSFDVFSNSLDVGLIGAALGIRLIHKSAISRPSSGVPDGAEWYSSVSFDNVRLTVSPVPLPAAVWLFGTALLGLIGFSKRRKAV